MRCTSAYTFAKVIRLSSKTMLESVVSIEGNVDVFSPFCDLKIGIVEDVGKCAVEVRLV